MAPSWDTPDFRRAVVSPQALLASVASPGATATVTLPPNTQTLVVACQGGTGTITATATGAVTGLPYPGTRLKQGTGTGANDAFHFNVAHAVDSQITVAVSGSPNWWVYADHARHTVVYPRPAPPPATAPILFCSFNHAGYGQISVVNFNGTGFVQLTADTHDYTWCRWSPDGTKILAGDSSNRVWILTSAGVVVRQLTLATGGQVGFAQGDWSPDGTQVVLSGATSGSGSNTESDLQIVKADNSSASAVGLTAKMSLFAASVVSWSPDATKFLYATNATPATGGSGLNATRCLTNGSSPVNILAGSASSAYLPWRWYPDSTNILVVQSGIPSLSSHLYKSDGSTTTTLYTDTSGSHLNYASNLGCMDPTQTDFAWNDTAADGLEGLTGGTASRFYLSAFGVTTNGMDWLQ